MISLPSASSARLKGDDYQHLYTWHQILSLQRHGSRAVHVGIEIPGVGAVDDVATWRRIDGKPAADYSQIKFHVKQSALYTTEGITALKRGRGQSLLQKLYGGWQRVSAIDPEASIALVSNWAWDPNDAIGPLIDGCTCQVKQLLLPTASTAVATCRTRWQEHLSASDEELAGFVNALRLITPFSYERQLADHVAERMASIGLKYNEAAIAAGVHQVRDWIKEGAVDHDVASLEAAIERFDLRAQEPEPFAVIHLHTIIHKAFIEPADFILDWVDLFEGGEDEARGHIPIDARSWQDVMLPQLVDLRDSINRIPDVRLLKMRGQARISAWIAAGYVFRQTAGYELEAKQGPFTLRTDVPPTADFQLAAPQIIELGQGSEIAVGISVTNDLSEDVLAYLRTQAPEYGTVVFLRPDRPLGPTGLRQPGDWAALAQGVKQRIQRVARERGARRLGIFYLGPFSAALFIGHQLNAVAREIQVFEDAAPGYVPSFLLRG